MNANVQTQLANSQSHSRLPIERRRVKLDFSDITDPSFHAGNRVISAYWVGLSATFPKGEAEFINSVRAFEDQITDPKLKAEVADFAAQEAHHSLQHKLINKHFDSLGYDTGKIEAFIDEEIESRVSKWSNEKRLARTVAAEHITATFAHFALTQTEQIDEMPESLAKLFQWHAIEEIEHKSVAFDVYTHCVGDMAKLKRHYAAFVFVEFPFNVYMITRFLLKEMGHKATWQERKGMIRYLFGKNGMVRSVWSHYIQFMKKDFHPWKIDDAELVEEWKTELSPMFSHLG